MLGELTPEQIDEVLRTAVIGRIGCHAEGRTYVVPIVYAYDGTSVLGHSAPGLKLQMMRANPEVCFEVDLMEDLADWRSVITWGRFEELSGEEAERAMRLLVARLTPVIPNSSADPSHAQSQEAGQATLYRIRLAERTGRFEQR